MTNARGDRSTTARRLARPLGALAGVIALGVALRAPARPRSPWPTPPAPPTDAGPIAREIPAGAAVAEDSASLAALLAEPNGPKEIWLRAKLYDGDFAISRPLALRAERGARIRGTGAGTVVTIAADDVTLENVAIEHSGRRHTAEDAGIKAKGDRVRIADVDVKDSLFGISIGPCAACTIEHVHVRGIADETELAGDGIKLWESSGSTVRRSIVERARDVVVWYSRHVLLDENVVRHCRYGTHFMYAHDSIVRRSRIENDVVGIFVMYSARLHAEDNVLAGARGPAGVGIGFKESDGVDVRRNYLVANTTGTYLDRTPRSAATPVVFEGNVLALNDVAVRFLGAEEGLTFRGNDFHDDVVTAEVEGGGDARSTLFEGNVWSDYQGYDLDHDGTGDVPFQIKRLAGELTDAHPSLRLFTGTLAMAGIDAIAHAVPVLATHVMLEDRSPRIAEAR